MKSWMKNQQFFQFSEGLSGKSRVFQKLFTGSWQTGSQNKQFHMYLDDLDQCQNYIYKDTELAE